MTAEQELREQLKEDLLRHLDRDVHRSGYVIAWIARELTLTQLERLLDELDGMYGAPGRQ
ncbi:hypothetical protein ACFV9C_23285 [Kribbella sp. NPDC059898]|uniref:hypothetical protein n=1 Tax=Kribbella sp. NPDC059898 TaxID=3346995 RepID=UPI00364E9C18